jgi:hypothetical protein
VEGPPRPWAAELTLLLHTKPREDIREEKSVSVGLSKPNLESWGRLLVSYAWNYRGCTCSVSQQPKQDNVKNVWLQHPDSLDFTLESSAPRNIETTAAIRLGSTE